jgi:DNA-directed RNA polymerase specialized sigma subunit
MGHLGSLCDEERSLVQRARVSVEARLEEKTRQAFRLLVDEECTAEEVASRLGMSKFSVWQVRSRVLRKLREELNAAPNDAK